MEEYRIELKRSAQREIEALTSQIGMRILTAVQNLGEEPRPRQCTKLRGSENSYRIRVGAYRILYQINDGDKTVTIFAIGHRRDVYR